MLQDTPSTTKTSPHQDKTRRLKEMLNRNWLILLTKSQANAHNMPKTTHPSGNWGEKQKSDLRKLINSNEVDYTRQDTAYLWEICQLEPPSLVQLQMEKTLQSNACEGNSWAM